MTFAAHHRVQGESIGLGHPLQPGVRPVQWAGIDVGQTRADWIRTTFGAPDRITSYDDGTEVWRYRNSSTSESKIGLFLLFRINVERDSTETLALEIRQGVVTDYWLERR